MSKKLSPAQQKALDKMKEGVWESSYSLQVSLGTLNALGNKGLVESKHGAGAFFCPRTGIEWRKKNTPVT